MHAALRLSLIALALTMAIAPARADDDVVAFYRGKTLTITNAFAEGGLYANLARMIAQHLPHHIPGRPSMVPQFMPGETVDTPPAAVAHVRDLLKVGK